MTPRYFVRLVYHAALGAILGNVVAIGLLGRGIENAIVPSLFQIVIATFVLRIALSAIAHASRIANRPSRTVPQDPTSSSRGSDAVGPESVTNSASA